MTEADIAIGKYIVEQIQTRYPDHNVIDEEAGGLHTDYFGNPMDYKNALNRTEENFTMCAGAPLLHEQIQHIIQKV